MAEAALCTSCAGWLCAAEDAWCGNCGAGCARASLTVDPDILQLNNIAPTLHFAVTNRSCAELPVERIDLPDWIKAVDIPTTISPGQTLRFLGHARTMSLKTPEAATIQLHLGAGRAETVALAIEEIPTLECVPAELEIWGSGRKRLEFTIQPRAGSLRIGNVRRGPLGELEVVTSPSKLTLSSPQKGVPVVVQVDVDRFRKSPSHSLTVDFDGPHGVRQAELIPAVKLRNPPDMRWQGENEPPAKRFTAIGQRLDFAIANQAPDGRDGGARNARLVIENVRLEPPQGLPDIPIRLLHTALPLSLPGGESATISFEADLSKLSPAASPLHLRLVVESNGPTLDKRVTVFVQPLPEYDGVLAIDFGSSNTCAALVETGREYETLALDGKDEVSPTIVRYMDLTGPVPEIETGARVKRLALTDDRVAASTAKALKQRLGDEEQDIPVRPYNSDDWTTRTATLAAADYLRELRRTLELRKQTIFRDFLLTHPAVCSLRQYRNLYLALTGAFGASAREVRFLQEPVAALIPFFADQAARFGDRTYTVASFDLGGGTTDISVVRVQNIALSASRMEIRPTILYSRGVRFGGEDLTDFLESHLAWRINEILKVRNPGATLIADGVSGASSEDKLRNEFAIRNVADWFKASLSEAGRLPDLKTVRLRVQTPNDLAGDEFSVDVADLIGGAHGDLKPAFAAELRERVNAIARLLLAAEQRVGKLDFIQLSGMTSYLPDVGLCIREMFPQATVVRSRDPKECVVKGACLSRAMSRGSARYLALPDGATRTTSSVGLYDVTAAVFTTILPVDTAIPGDGLIGEVPEAWFGSERIALWENLGVSDDELRTDGTRSLSKLGTWQPEEKSISASQSAGWTLRVRLKDFELDVRAVGPRSEAIRFRPLQTSGAAK